MRTGDGLLARIRVPHGRLKATQMVALAEAGRHFGNGLIEITARGNLQVRGLREDAVEAFAEAIEAILAVETGLVADLSPLSGDDPAEMRDPRPIVAAIRAGSDAFIGRLAPKTSVVVDGGGQIGLGGLKADIRLVANPAGWSVSLGGGPPQVMDDETAIAAALATLGAMAAMGPETRAADLFPGHSALQTTPAPVGWIDRTTGRSLGIALPFSASRADTLLELLAAVAEAYLRLAPGHVLLLDDVQDGFVHHARALGFIVEAGDPRLRVSACAGSDGCASGLVAARQIGAALAGILPPRRHLHVSGCIKGCAHPGPADVTLSGRAEGIGLVFNGRAGDTPQEILAEAELADRIRVHQDA